MDNHMYLTTAVVLVVIYTYNKLSLPMVVSNELRQSITL